MFIKFVYFETERVHVNRKSQKEKATESQAGSALSAESLMWGLNSWTVRSWPVPRSRFGHSTTWATQEPHILFFCFFRETEREGERGRGRERQRGRERAFSREHRLDPTTLGSWPELKSRVRSSTQMPQATFLFLTFALHALLLQFV